MSHHWDQQIDVSEHTKLENNNNEKTKGICGLSRLMLRFINQDTFVLVELSSGSDSLHTDKSIRLMTTFLGPFYSPTRPL